MYHWVRVIEEFGRENVCHIRWLQKGPEYPEKQSQYESRPASKQRPFWHRHWTVFSSRHVIKNRLELRHQKQTTTVTFVALRTGIEAGAHACVRRYAVSENATLWANCCGSIPYVLVEIHDTNSHAHAYPHIPSHFLAYGFLSFTLLTHVTSPARATVTVLNCAWLRYTSPMHTSVHRGGALNCGDQKKYIWHMSVLGACVGSWADTLCEVFC